MLIPQIIATPLTTSGYGIVMGLLMLVGCIITSGTVVLVARMISSMAGGVSVLFGKHGRADLLKAYGVIMLPLSLWMMLSVFLDAQKIGFF
jgi:predicted Co/Zn/Cd cation transporter (cation efflux family)